MAPIKPADGSQDANGLQQDGEGLLAKGDAVMTIYTTTYYVGFELDEGQQSSTHEGPAADESRHKVSRHIFSCHGFQALVHRLAAIQ